MPDLGSIFNFGNFFGGGFTDVITIVLAGLMVGSFVGLILWFIYTKKKWNLGVEFKIPRSDGKIVYGEWGKGAYDTKRGVVWIKRKGMKKVAMKPFDVKQFLQGKSILTVVQIGATDFRPVLNDSWVEMVDTKTGESAAIMEMKTDLSESKAWRNSFERDSKAAYSVMNLLKDYAPMIGMAIVLLFNFVGFAILYTRIG